MRVATGFLLLVEPCRYFIQARFYAKENKQVVDQIIASRTQQQ